MITFTGRPGSAYLRFCCAIELAQSVSGVDAWDAARALAPQIAADIDEKTANSGTLDIVPQVSIDARATPVGAFAVGFTGKASTFPT